MFDNMNHVPIFTDLKAKSNLSLNALFIYGWMISQRRSIYTPTETITVKRQQLADVLGSTLPTIDVALNALTEAGLISSANSKGRGLTFNVYMYTALQRYR